MGSRMKEDERHEMVIRKLLKMPQNKRCINCDRDALLNVFQVSS
jgi:hypothetical protein